jgi:hypothetical protein
MRPRPWYGSGRLLTAGVPRTVKVSIEDRSAGAQCLADTSDSDRIFRRTREPSRTLTSVPEWESERVPRLQRTAREDLG